MSACVPSRSAVADESSRPHGAVDVAPSHSAIRARLRELNERLLQLSRSREDVYRDVSNKLAAHKMLALYDLTIDVIERPDGKPYCRVLLTIDEDGRRRRRRFDGFVLLIAQPELPQSGAELARLYRAKDAVEKDFRTIKEVIKVRPVFHHTDPKVRAHVTVCMLSLLLERTLEQRLRRSSTPMTTPACLEQLRGCHLNLLRGAPELAPSYQLTELTPEQRAIVTNLRMTDLVDAESLQTQLRPRAVA